MKKIFIAFLAICFVFILKVNKVSASPYDQSIRTASSTIQAMSQPHLQLSNIPADARISRISFYMRLNQPEITSSGCDISQLDWFGYMRQVDSSAWFNSWWIIATTNPDGSNNPYNPEGFLKYKFHANAQDAQVDFNISDPRGYITGAELNRYPLEIYFQSGANPNACSFYSDSSFYFTYYGAVVDNPYVSKWINGNRSWELPPFLDYNQTPYLTFTEYNPAPAKTPVLIIPGTLGTEIDKGNEILWPDISRMFKFSLNHSDDFMDPLGFKLDGTPLDTDLSLGSILTAPNEQYNYSQQLISDFQSQGYRSNQNLFLFPYDWRKDITNNADVFLRQTIENIASSTGSSKIDIIAHSQGGLVIKKLLFDHPEYQSRINKLVFVGTPNLGAPQTAKILAYGDDFGIKKYGLGLDPLEIKKIAQNMPAVYQMLPSKEYFNHSTGYLGQYTYTGDFKIGKILSSFNDTKNALKSPEYNLNSGLIDSADNFHSSSFDNFDFTNSGIQTFNIMGCESGTIGKIYINGTGGKNDITYEPGDGTVPLVSASNIGGAQNFYVLKTGDLHGTMLTTDGLRQKIVKLITGTSTPTDVIITTNPALCVFKGKKVEVHSPVDLSIYDEKGNHVGPNPDGSFDYQIDGVQYDEIGHNKYAFLPDDGHTYTVKLFATGAGTFNFYSSEIVGYQTTSIAYYNDVPVSASSTARVLLTDSNNQNIEFTSDSRVISPSSFLSGSLTQDSAAPISTSTISGVMGSAGFYRTNATITLSSLDPIVNNDRSQTSGVLVTKYNLDNTAYQTYNTSTPIVVTAEGPHTFTFYSTDKAGNNEPEQTISFIIDKTPPEFVVQFDPSIKDISFTATDTLQTTLATSTAATSKIIKWGKIPPIKITDSDNIITATDAAGNTTVLTLKDKNRKLQMKAEVKSLAYNGKTADISKILLHFDWLYDKKGSPLLFTQQAQSKNDFNILSIYGLGKTVIVGKDQTGKIKLTKDGLVPLKVTTKAGDFGWGY
jgi:pimeloyl-ACP methyl ester carboxylesterase